MGLSVSIVLIAIGAILTWGVTAEAEGLDVNAIGVILMVVGALGLLLSLAFWSSWGGFGGRRRTAVYDDGVAARRAPGARRTVVEEEELAPPPGPPGP
jgi:hypothetical protein